MRVLTYPYSDAYTPSMPVVDLGVSQPGARQPAQVVTAVVDSGADGTLVPIDVLEAVSAGYVGEAFIRGDLRKKAGSEHVPGDIAHWFSRAQRSASCGSS